MYRATSGMSTDLCYLRSSLFPAALYTIVFIQIEAVAGDIDHPASIRAFSYSQYVEVTGAGE